MTLLLCCSCSNPLIAPQAAAAVSLNSFPVETRCAVTLRNASTEFVGRGRLLNAVSGVESKWSFVGGSRIVLRPKVSRAVFGRNGFRSPSAYWLTSQQIACNAFTCGTVAVLPFYTLMVLAPNAEITRKTMESNAIYVVLGFVYAYLLYLSWTPDTLRCMFASKYWLPELSGMAKMFSNELTMASAWIHLLAVDLFAARQVFQDGLENKVETRHSVSLCLLFCPIGILAHFFTKLLTKTAK